MSAPIAAAVTSAVRADTATASRTGRCALADVPAGAVLAAAEVIPSYDYCGEDGNKAPRLEGLWHGHPVPDLDVSREGSRFWAEVKTKDHANHFHKTGTDEHGIDLRLAQHYHTVEVISGTPCWLFIYEESTRWLLAQRFDRLVRSRIGTHNGTKIINYPRDLFRQLEQIEGGA